MASISITPSIEEIAKSVRGSVLAPGDADFAEATAAFNAAVQHRPDVVVAATCAEDVQAAVRWAAANDLQVSVQATGHGATQPIEGGVLVTTAGMQSLHIDPSSRLAIIDAGVRWRRVIDEAAPFELAPLNGSSSDAGAVGYTLGGGLAVLGRTFGFASDWVVAFEVVTADGELHRVTADDEPELFWALRGGKSDAAIVTSMTVELLPISEFYGGSIYYDGENAPEIMRAYAEWARTLPDEMTTAIALMRLPDMPEVPEPLRERFTVQLRVAFVGDAADGDALMRSMRDIAPSIIDYVGMMPYTEIDRVHNDPEHPLPFDYQDVMLSDLSDEVIGTLMAEAGPGIDTPVLMVEIRQLGGAMDREAPDSVGIRTDGFLVMFLGVLFPGGEEIVPSAITAGCAALSPFATGASFVNLHGSITSDADKMRPWPAEMGARLTELKTRLDPDNRFRFGHWS
jgi:FAD/FMN-containing dehydrogenase